MVYSNPVKPGTSGGPVLNDRGQLVGINGQAIQDARTGAVDYLGIPINIYVKLASVSRGNSPSVSPSPSPSTRIVSSSSRTAPAPQPSPTPDRVSYFSRSNFSLVKTLTGHTGPIQSVATSFDGQTLASGSRDGSIKIWNLSTGKEIRTLTGHSDLVWPVAISPDGRTLVSGSDDKTIKIWQMVGR
ncbi:MAG: hypothetical protein KME17_13145 [Cyanosarcina radialis HA8281-LM2]|nr:hypothetical protein [Cyanosarcina radialis HA8281-LM2]